ncbi:MAG TPA: Crp/Fnr family transcriptional regulator [Devosiaceae bacterium]|nr:Crp/Fnr family transcriptional regulator [Devosiaceae bacterium]
MPEAIDILIRRLETIGYVTATDRDLLADLPMRITALSKGEDAASDGEVVAQSCLLLKGFMHRYKVLPDGSRQILAFHTPGEIPDLHSLHLTKMDHSLAATERSTVAFLKHTDILALLERSPNISRLFWRATLIDSAVFRTWMVEMGQRPAVSHLAHQICEVYVKLFVTGLARNWVFRLPLVQEEIADALGLSAVHTNRTLQDLRARQLIHFESGNVRILSWEGLVQLAQFDPTYLHFREDVVLPAE